jgi:ketosteroid isomerase-like protein
MTTITDPKIASVQSLYAAFGAGDMDGVLAVLADDVDWAAEAAGTGAPWYGSYRGVASVPAFFAAIASNVTIHEFDVQSYTSNDTDVIATVHWNYTVNKTGKSASMYMQHWYRFAGDKVVFFRGSEDSAQSVAVFS